MGLDILLLGNCDPTLNPYLLHTWPLHTQTISYRPTLCIHSTALGYLRRAPPVSALDSWRKCLSHSCVPGVWSCASPSINNCRVKTWRVTSYCTCTRERTNKPCIFHKTMVQKVWRSGEKRKHLCFFAFIFDWLVIWTSHHNGDVTLSNG